MKFCNKCGKENKDTAKFCKDCGNPIPVEEQVIELYCGQCGKANKKTTKFCMYCGSKLINSTTADITPEKKILATETSETILLQNKEETDRQQTYEAPVSKVVELKDQHIAPIITEVESNKQKQINESTDSSGFAAFEIAKEIDESLPQPQIIKAPAIAEDHLKTDVLAEVSEADTKSTTDLSEIGDVITEDNINQQNEKEVDEDSAKDDYMLAYNEIFNNKGKGRFKKRLAWGIGIIVIMAAGTLAYFYFNSSAKKTEPVTVKTKEVLTRPASDSSAKKDSVILEGNNTPITPPLIATEEPDLPTAPSQKQVLIDLAAVSLCNNAITVSEASVLSFNIISKNSKQCIVVITFSQAGSDTRYVVSVLYENRDKNFAYKTSNCTVKLPQKKPSDITPVIPPGANHDVRSDLITYLSNKKSFAGIGYDDVGEVSVTRIGAPVKYDDTGNTSYTVELVINTRSCKCQAIYTAMGKFYVNALK